MPAGERSTPGEPVVRFGKIVAESGGTASERASR